MSPSIGKETVQKRAQELLATRTGAGMNAAATSEAYHGALNLLGVVHGPDSVQARQLIQAMTVADKAKDGNRAYNLHAFVSPAVRGALQSLQADVQAGLTGSIVMQASGEILGDHLALAKEALAAGGEPQKNVAAVLVAAAFEDTLRRLAETKAGVTDRPKLEEVIGRLKTSGALAGAAVSTATGHLRFRNDSLHADWTKVQVATVNSCMAFVEGLLREHFS